MKTPQLPAPKLSQALGIPNEIWLKREDEHHFGSHKGRSIPLIIAERHRSGTGSFVISSSGNAALAAARAVKAHNKNKPGDQIRLQIFIGPKISPRKQELIEAENDPLIAVASVKNPKQSAKQFTDKEKAILLRQSTEPLALSGYHELADELAKIENLAAVFVPTSSGTTAQGLSEGFALRHLNPQIHIVQTTACHPIVDIINPQTADSNAAENSLADAIVDKIAYRKKAVAETVKNSRGNGWIATNEEILQAMNLMKAAVGLNISPNSALSVAGLTKAILADWKWSGPVACLITGA